MKIKEIAFVAYAMTDVKRSRDFYERILGLVPGNVWEGEDSAFIEYEIGPHTLAIGKGSDNFKTGTTGATAALEVEDFDQAVAELKKEGVKFSLKPLESPVCWMALINDPDGNQIMIHKRKEKWINPPDPL